MVLFRSARMGQSLASRTTGVEVPTAAAFFGGSVTLAAEGAANRALIKALASALRVRRSDVKIVRGLHSRHKWVRIEDPGDDLAQRWSRLLSTVD